MKNSEFYIGWMPKAPEGFARHTRMFLLILLPLVLLVGYLLSSSQKKFSTANFEFGKLTQVKGIYFNQPVPMLKVVDKNNTAITILLVGYGKHGAETAIMELEKEKNMSFNNRALTLKGTLLYSDGKTLMQIDAAENPVVTVGEMTDASFSPQQKDLGFQKFKGEIIDPKCYFGVMKPGEGKVHRDCAIRCILGGIPPVLKVMNEKGEKNYYLLVGLNGEKINEAVQDFVAEPVEIEAKAIKQDDWVILYVTNKAVSRISAISLYKSENQVASCSTGCCKR